MNYATHKISLDIHKPESQTVLHMKRTDTGRKIKISLTEDGRPYILTPDCSAVFKAKKPDGHDIKVDCEIEGNVIIYTVSFQTTTMLGEVECEIMLYNESGMLITSPRFAIIVNDTVQSEGSIAESDSEASTKLDKLLKIKTKSAVEEYFKENPITGISEEQEHNLNANTQARHTHSNGSVLDMFADDNGTLIYNGNPVGSPAERATATIHCATEDAFFLVETESLGTNMVTASYQFEGDENPEVVALINNNYEIKDISIVVFDEVIPLSRVGEKDSLPFLVTSNRPYFYHNPENYYIILFSAYYPGTMGYLASMATAINDIIITYYTD